MKKESNYPRKFREGERVCYDKMCEYPRKAMVVHDQCAECEEDKIDLFVFLNEEDDDSSGIETRKAKAREIYQLSGEDKFCPKCGEPLCNEHFEYIDYPYYCPWCQENFYGIEVE